MQQRFAHIAWLGVCAIVALSAQAFAASPAPKKAAAVKPIAAPVLPANRPVRIAAVVNDEVITTADVEDRALLLMALTGAGATPESRAKVVTQSLQMLIDETLQLQEASRNSIRVSDSEVDAAIAAMEKARGRPAGAFLGFVRASNLSVPSIKRQFEAQVAWNKTVTRKLRRTVTITEDEIARAQQTALNAPAEQQVLIAALSIPIRNAAQEKTAAALAASLGNMAQSGKSFEEIARSVASNQEVLLVPAIWMEESRLEPAIAQALRNISVGQMTQPLRSLATYQLIQLQDKRDVARVSPDTEVALKQISLALANNASAKEVDALMMIAREIQQNPGSCDERGIAGIESFEGLNIKVRYLRNRLKELKEQLRALILPMGVGDVTVPYLTKQGIEMMMLCEKIEAPMPLPDKDTVKDSLYAERSQLEAEKMLRNLKRDAFIEVRTGESE